MGITHELSGIGQELHQILYALDDLTGIGRGRGNSQSTGNKWKFYHCPINGIYLTAIKKRGPRLKPTQKPTRAR